MDSGAACNNAPLSSSLVLVALSCDQPNLFISPRIQQREGGAAPYARTNPLAWGPACRPELPSPTEGGCNPPKRKTERSRKTRRARPRSVCSASLRVCPQLVSRKKEKNLCLMCHTIDMIHHAMLILQIGLVRCSWSRSSLASLGQQQHAGISSRVLAQNRFVSVLSASSRQSCSASPIDVGAQSMIHRALFVEQSSDGVCPPSTETAACLRSAALPPRPHFYSAPYRWFLCFRSTPFHRTVTRARSIGSMDLRLLCGGGHSGLRHALVVRLRVTQVAHELRVALIKRERRRDDENATRRAADSEKTADDGGTNAARRRSE